MATGVKPACRLKADRNQLASAVQAGRALGLVTVVGQDSISEQPIAARGGYSEWCRREELVPSTRGRVFIYLARSRQVAERLRRLDEADLEERVGGELGYPPCCIRSFLLRRGAATKDPVLERYSDDKPIPWLLNVSLLHLGASLLTHVPCGPQCEPSLRLAMKYFEVLFTENRRRADSLSRTLVGCVVHTDVLGVAAFLPARRDGDSIEVGTALAVDAGSPVGKALLQAREVHRTPQGLRIGELALTRPRARLFDFR